MSSKDLKCFIVVHGEKPYRQCAHRQEFLNRLEKAIELAQKEVVDGIIVSGGTAFD